MDRRRLTLTDAFELAMVVLVLAAGGLLLAGVPDAWTGRDGGPRADWTCVSPDRDAATCGRRAEGLLMEGRAAGTGRVDLSDGKSARR